PSGRDPGGLTRLNHQLSTRNTRRLCRRGGIARAKTGKETDMDFKRTELYAAGEITNAEHQLVRTALAAIDAFWDAVEQDPQWGSTMNHPINCCILSALAVRDILHGLGRRDAVVLRMGLDIRVLEGSELPHSISIGNPAAE